MALTKITPQMFDTSATTHDLNVDNGTFVVDGSASRVGIGTPTPSTLLDVNGTATATTFVGALTGNVTGTILTAAQTNITSLGTLSALTVTGTSTLGVVDASSFTDVITNTIYTQSSSLDIDTVLTGRDVTFTQGSTNLMIVKGDASGVGIGVSSLTEKLEVSGSINATNQSANFATGAQRGFLDMVNASKHVRIGSVTGAATATGTQGTVEIVVNNSARVVVDENGNVGIGETSPQQQLVVKNGSGDSQIKIQSGTSNDAYLSFNNGTTLKHYFKQDNTGLFELYYYNGSTGVSRIAVKTDGNVGIGTDTPSAGVHVVADVNPVMKLDRGSANTANANLYYNGTFTGQISAANADFQISAVGSSTPMSFYTNGAERMSITSGGSVGIAIVPKTTSNTVTGSLNVDEGGLIVRNSNQAYFASNIYWDASDQLKSHSAGYGIALGYIPSDGSYRFYSTTASASGADQNLTLNEKMRIDGSGKVGIGTGTEATPSGSLHVRTKDVNGADVAVVAQNTTNNRIAGFHVQDENGGARLKMQYDNGSNLASIINDSPAACNFNILTTAPRNTYVALNYVAHIAESFNLAGNVTYNFEYTVPNEGGHGNSFFIIAGFNHFHSSAYGAHRVAFVSTRGTSLSVHSSIINQTSSNGGQWNFTKPNSTTLRIQKAAGTYTGSGSGFIQVFFRNAIG